MDEQNDPLGVIGQRAAGFTIKALLAEGGMGAIYLAERTEANETLYAVKCIPCMGPEGQIAMLKKIVEQEALLLRRLSKANVPRYEGLAFLAVPGRAGVVGCIFMEYLHGESLRRRITRHGDKGLPLRSVVPFLSGAVTALAHAHRNIIDNNRQEIVAHLDLKPENIFLQRFGNVDKSILLDLGVARRLLLAPRQTGSVIDQAAFTLMYGAPEQFDPETFGAPGTHTDVFALALIIIEMLTGKVALLNLPYDGIPAGYPVFQRAYMSAVNPGRRPSLRHRLEPQSSGEIDLREIEIVLERALAVNPHHRHVDVIDFWQDFCRSAGETIETEIVSLSSIPPPVASIRSSLLPPPSSLAGRNTPTSQAFSVSSFPGDTEPSPLPVDRRSSVAERISDTPFPKVRSPSLVPASPRTRAPGQKNSQLFPVALVLSVIVPVGIGWKITRPEPSKDHTPGPSRSPGSAGSSTSTQIPVAPSTSPNPGISLASPPRQKSTSPSLGPNRINIKKPEKKGNKSQGKPCEKNEKKCGGACVDVMNHREHCGDCGTPCESTCIEGKCQPKPPHIGPAPSQIPTSPSASVSLPQTTSAIVIPFPVPSVIIPPPPHTSYEDWD